MIEVSSLLQGGGEHINYYTPSDLTILKKKTAFMNVLFDLI